MNAIEELIVHQDISIREVMSRIDRGAKGIVLLVDRDDCLVATITDGDVRRAILAGMSLDEKLDRLVAFKKQSGGNGPITVPADSPRQEQVEAMQRAGVKHVPLVDERGRVVALRMLDGLTESTLPVQAVIMAGGFGTRLRPLTDDVPKPMLTVGGRPLLEHTIESLEQAGIRRINVTTHYLPEKISDYFGNGRDFGVELTYVPEDRPLGTAGALGLVGATEEPLLVINGDILTRVDFRAMLTFHRDQGADLTVGTGLFGVEVPYGVIKAEGGRVASIQEKPKYDFLINAGIYLLEPSVRRYIPEGERYDMPDLITSLIDDGR